MEVAGKVRLRRRGGVGGEGKCVCVCGGVISHNPGVGCFFFLFENFTGRVTRAAEKCDIVRPADK